MTPLAAKIFQEIQVAGAISFARFMELALYSPELGYYERQKQIGQRGDFFTSVSVGSLFGELLAFQFSEWFDESKMQNLRLIEAGAHDGQLVSDILSWLKKNRQEIFDQLNYSIIEPSENRRSWQKETLAEFSGKISWFDDLSALRGEIGGSHFTIVFSNELFDAMPVHRLSWDAQKKSCFEWGVGCDGKNLVWKRLSKNQISNDAIPQLASDLAEILPDGFTTEVCPAAIDWWKKAASIVNAGKLVAIDYGLLGAEFFAPNRSTGTLRAFSHHHATSDLLAQPGEQDITAHVNFTALKEAGEKAGLKTESLISQPKFLTGIAERSWKKFGEWDARRRKQFQTLVHPEHLGRAFKVLIQSR